VVKELRVLETVVDDVGRKVHAEVTFAPFGLGDD
jgi:hypothetical protein